MIFFKKIIITAFLIFNINTSSSNNLYSHIIQISIPMSQKDAETFKKSVFTPYLFDKTKYMEAFKQIKNCTPIKALQIHKIYYKKRHLIIKIILITKSQELTLEDEKQFTTIFTKTSFMGFGNGEDLTLENKKQFQKIFTEYIHQFIKEANAKTQTFLVSIPMSKKDAKNYIIQQSSLSSQGQEAINSAYKLTYTSTKNKINKIIPILDMYNTYYITKNGLTMHSLMTTTKSTVTKNQKENLKHILLNHFNLTIAQIKSKTELIIITTPMSQAEAKIIVNEFNKREDISLINLIVEQAIGEDKELKKIIKIKALRINVNLHKNGLVMSIAFLKMKNLTAQQKIKVEEILKKICVLPYIDIIKNIIKIEQQNS